MLEEDGELRVMRIENLVRQSSRSAAYGAPQLWLLAEWVLSDAGRAVRGPLAREFVRLLDVAVAGRCACICGRSRLSRRPVLPVIMMM